MDRYPGYLINAVRSDTKAPNPTRIGVTELINPPLHRTLFHKNWDKIKRDPGESVWMLLGSGLDEIVKRYSTTALTKLKLELPTIHGITVVAVPDMIDTVDKVLADLKVTSVWSVKETKKEYTYQLNLYHLLLKKLQPELAKQVERLEIHAILRDWRRNEKLRYHDYPVSQFIILPIDIWSTDEQEQFLDAQLQDHLQHPERECTNEEKWQKLDQFAVMKAGRKSALRVLDSEQEAINWCNTNGHLSNLGKSITIVKRPGECVRCENYCSVASFCKYYQESLDSSRIRGLETSPRKETE